MGLERNRYARACHSVLAAGGSWNVCALSRIKYYPKIADGKRFPCKCDATPVNALISQYVDVRILSQ